MRWREGEELRLGPDVVQMLIPHRRPLLMVDAVDAFRREPQPTLWARRHVSANEEVFAGHFPGLHLWPGIYTIEGLGQTSLLLGVLVELVAGREARGGTADEVLHALRQLERARSLSPGARPPDPGLPRLIGELSASEPRIGMSGQIEMKLLAPVFAGQMIEYRAVMTHTLDSFARFEVEAEVGGVAVARGLMTGVSRPLFQPDRTKS
jgi:3-hydroxyacyl-[acyl-carrier-protein] dehydratase